MNVKYFVNKIVDSLILFRTACSISSSDYMEVFFPKNVLLVQYDHQIIWKFFSQKMLAKSPARIRMALKKTTFYIKYHMVGCRCYTNFT